MQINQHKEMKLFVCTTVIALIFILGGCAATQPNKGTEAPAIEIGDVLNEDDIIAIKEVHDPWEGYNRSVYNFNAKFDRYIFLPTVNAYRKILPNFARKGIHNFFSNLGEFSNLTNSIFQGKVTQSGRTAGRLLVNSTLGIGGLMDPATGLGLFYQREDFGQTLGHWGIGPGPYFVLPILGPSTFRDFPSAIVDRIYHPVYDPYPWLVDIKSAEATAMGVVNAVDTRANISFKYYEMGTPFEYLWSRNLWLDYRKLEVKK